MSDTVSRRRFLASAGAAVGLAPLVAGCSSGPDQTSQCQGYGSLSAAELQQRQALQYVDDSPKLGQVCTTCRLYNQPAEGQSCGGCQLFPGPVLPQAWCTAWAAS